jgi:hypothetical protein
LKLASLNMSVAEPARAPVEKKIPASITLISDFMGTPWL